MHVINEKSFPRVKHQVVIRNTRFGDYLLFGDNVIELNDTSKEILEKCDGLHTIQEIAEWAAKKEGEKVDSVYRELLQFLKTLADEEIIIYNDSPNPIVPIYNYDRPLSIIWEITYTCNQKCEYCIARAGKPSPSELSQDEIDTILDELIELKVGLINITGGEPLLRKDTALHIAQRASENGIELDVLTNGTLVTPQVAQELFEAGVRNAQVSLDCSQPTVHDKQRGVNGAWKKAVEAIHNLKEAGISVVAAAVITKSNFEYLEETRKFLVEIADEIKIGPVLPMGRGENNECLLTPEMILQVLKSRGRIGNQLTDFIFPKETCSIGTTPVIAPNGDVYPCMLTKYDELRLGNLRETSLRSIYKKSDLLHELFTWNVDKIHPCGNCKFRYYCGAGCRGCAFAYHGTIYGNDPYNCEARRKYAKELLKHGHPLTKKALEDLIS